MPCPKHFADILSEHLPEAAIEPFWQLLNSLRLQMRISRPRRTKFGDFRPPSPHKSARISVNADLPKPAFLLTAVHELAHAKVYLDYSKKGTYSSLAPHGKEWKTYFKDLMQVFLKDSIYPEPTLSLVKAYLENPAASSMRDVNLFKTLHTPKTSADSTPLSEVQNGQTFEHRNMKFRRIEPLRVYIKCENLDNGKLYRMHPSIHVKVL